MFCSNCGKEVSEKDKFCKECGFNLNSTNTINSSDEYDVENIVNQFGNNRIEAVKYLSNTYNIKLGEAKKIIDAEYNKRKKTSSLSSWEIAKQQVAQKNLEKQQEKSRLEELKKEKIPFCPKCHSTNLTAQKKRF